MTVHQVRPKKKKKERVFNPPELKAQENFSIQNLSIVVVVIKFSQFYLLKFQGKLLKNLLKINRPEKL